LPRVWLLPESWGRSLLCDPAARVRLPRRWGLLAETTRLPRRRAPESTRITRRRTVAGRWALLAEPAARVRLPRRWGLLAETTRLPRRRALRWLRVATLRIHGRWVVRRARRWCIRDRGGRLLIRRHHLGGLRTRRPTGARGLLPRSGRRHHLSRLRFGIRGARCRPRLRRGVRVLTGRYGLGRFRRIERSLFLLWPARRVLGRRLFTVPRLVRWLRRTHAGYVPP